MMKIKSINIKVSLIFEVCQFDILLVPTQGENMTYNCTIYLPERTERSKHMVQNHNQKVPCRELSNP